MSDQMVLIYHKISSDDIANTMKESSVSQSFLVDRIREIIEDCIIDEKENQIERNIQELAYLRTEVKTLRNDLHNQSQIPL